MLGCTLHILIRTSGYSPASSGSTQPTGSGVDTHRVGVGAAILSDAAAHVIAGCAAFGAGLARGTASAPGARPFRFISLIIPDLCRNLDEAIFHFPAPSALALGMQVLGRISKEWVPVGEGAKQHVSLVVRHTRSIME